MCGISGCFAPGGLDAARFYAAHAALRHRGPDDEGLVGGADWRGETRQFSAEGTRGRWTELPDFREAGELRWALGQHRLSILDLSEDGHGPMGSADGRHWLTYNGEVYNYRELREELAALGHSFATGTDTEVVLARVRRVGHRLLRALQRHVGARALRRRGRAARPEPRPLRREAPALLAGSRGPRAGLGAEAVR